MTLNIREAEKRARCRVNMTLGSRAGVDQIAADLLLLAAAYREAVEAGNRVVAQIKVAPDGKMYIKEPLVLLAFEAVLAKAREVLK